MAYMPTLGATAGATGSSLLGQASDALSAPRRMLWSMLGMPEDGTELVSQTFGMDPESWLTKGLGVGAEMVADPLNLIGVPLGAMAGRLPRALQIKKELGALASGVPEMESSVNAARAAMENAVGSYGEHAARYAARTGGDLAQGATRAAEMAPDVMAMEMAAARPAVAMQPGIDDLMSQSMSQLGPRRAGALSERQMSGPSLSAMAAEPRSASPSLMAMERSAIAPQLSPIEHQAMLGRRAEGARNRYASSLLSASDETTRLNALLEELAGMSNLPPEEALSLLGGIGLTGAGMMNYQGG